MKNYKIAEDAEEYSKLVKQKKKVTMAVFVGLLKPLTVSNTSFWSLFRLSSLDGAT